MKIKYTEKIRQEARKLFIEGKSQREIGRLLNIPWQSVWSFIKYISPEMRNQMPSHGIQKVIPATAIPMSEAKARIIGYLSAEGYVTKAIKLNSSKYLTRNGIKIRKYKSQYVIVYFYNTNLTVVQRFINDCKDVYGFTPKYNVKKSAVNISRVAIFNDLNRYCTFGCFRWTIPSEITENNQYFSSWLQAFCDGEAHVVNNKSHKRVVISSSNIIGLNTIKAVLNRLGIVSYINGPYTGCYRLIISNRESLIKFSRAIGFNHSERKEKLENLIKTIQTK